MSRKIEYPLFNILSQGGNLQLQELLQLGTCEYINTAGTERQNHALSVNLFLDV